MGEGGGGDRQKHAETGGCGWWTSCQRFLCFFRQRKCNLMIFYFQERMYRENKEGKYILNIKAAAEGKYEIYIIP